MLIIASDGVWEFLTNQAVVDMVAAFDSPLEACHCVIAESYRLWLQFDVRTDDITIAVAFPEYSESALVISSQAAGRRGRRGSATGIINGLDIVLQGERKPVRGSSPELSRKSADDARPEPQVIVAVDVSGHDAIVHPNLVSSFDKSSELPLEFTYKPASSVMQPAPPNGLSNGSAASPTDSNDSKRPSATQATLSSTRSAVGFATGTQADSGKEDEVLDEDSVPIQTRHARKTFYSPGPH